MHHVTATVNDAQPDLEFYRDLLGLRLVKKTVNFDNPSVYHLYYGDERGTPGTVWTTFPYKGWGVAPGRHGRGHRRMRGSGTVPRAASAGSGMRAISFVDPSGLVIRLLEAKGDPRVPWTGSGVGADTAIRGLHSVTLTVADPAPTLALLTSVLGFTVVDESEHAQRAGRRAPLRRLAQAGVSTWFGTAAPRLA